MLLRERCRHKLSVRIDPNPTSSASTKKRIPEAGASSSTRKKRKSYATKDDGNGASSSSKKREATSIWQKSKKEVANFNHAEQNVHIKYQRNLPVKIKTHTGRHGDLLVDVGDLVAAYKTAVTPLLDLSSAAQLTLHSSAENDSEPLAGNCLLSSIGPGTGTFDNPLVIRSLKDSVVS